MIMLNFAYLFYVLLCSLLSMFPIMIIAPSYSLDDINCFFPDHTGALTFRGTFGIVAASVVLVFADGEFSVVCFLPHAKGWLDPVLSVALGPHGFG